MSQVKQGDRNPSGNGVTISLAPGGVGLASSASLIVGRCSSRIVLAPTSGVSPADAAYAWESLRFTGKIRVGTPTVNTGYIGIWVVGDQSDNGAGVYTFPNGITGSDAAFSWASEGQREAVARRAATLWVDTTTANTDWSFDFYLAPLFFLPPKAVVLYVAHSTGAALNATEANHVWNVYGQRVDG